MAKSPARDHRYDGARGCGDGSRNQAGFVADSACGMLIDLHAVDVAKIEYFAGARHAFGERAHLAVRHAGVKYSHQKRGDLIIRNFAARVTVDELFDFFRREFFAVPLPVDEV